MHGGKKLVGRLNFVRLDFRLGDLSFWSYCRFLGTGAGAGVVGF
jgi:hypothetical protein